MSLLLQRAKSHGRRRPSPVRPFNYRVPLLAFTTHPLSQMSALVLRAFLAQTLITVSLDPSSPVSNISPAIVDVLDL